MFERYTEAARRTLFFARYDASQLGSVTIEPEHLLLGLLREKRGPAARWLKGHLHDRIREDLVAALGANPPVPTQVEIPFSVRAKSILTSAAEEADDLRVQHIGTEHLLLALARDERSHTSALLAAHGLTFAELRRRAAALPESGGDLG
jgi:ATP-dependent Clp protease ATP-binding subunit ClpC